MTMNHHPRAERRLSHDPGGQSPPNEAAADGAWLEARIPIVLVVVLVTWVLIAAWKVLRQLVS